MSAPKRLVFPYLLLLCFAGVAGAQSAASPTTGPPAAPQDDHPTIAGAATWCFRTCDRGIAYPLTSWPSLFHLGRGELVALVGGEGAGIGLAHKFLYIQPGPSGRVGSSLSLGVAAIMPYTSDASGTRVNVWTTVRPAAVVVFTVDLPTGGH